MASGMTLLRGLGLGAAAMYFFDPDRGKRRRALVRDRMVHTIHSAEDGFDTTLRDLSNRINGLVAEVGSMFESDEADDRVIIDRVRSKLGRYASHPHAIHVECRNGRVTLSGPILSDEVKSLLAAIKSVRGVTAVANHLEAHHDRENISSLQGGVPPAGEHIDMLQRNWSPATRLLATTAGVGLMLNCAMRRTPMSFLLGTAGFGLFLRGATNLETGDLMRAAAGHYPVHVQRTYHIDAPVNRVYELITDWPRLATFLTNVHGVRDLGDGKLRWTLKSPAGGELKVDEAITENVPNERISWHTLPNSPFNCAGTVRLDAEGDNRTRVNVKMSYSMPGGAAGHAIATMLGMDADSQMQQDIQRVKSFLEEGHVPHDVAERAKSQQMANP